MPLYIVFSDHNTMPAVGGQHLLANTTRNDLQLSPVIWLLSVMTSASLDIRLLPIPHPDLT